jgi:hypothetical protein
VTRAGIVAGLAAVLLLVAPSGCRRGNASTPGQPALLDRAIHAAGGEGALGAVRSMEVRSHGLQTGSAYRTKMQRVLPDRCRDEMEVSDVVLAHGTDGKEIWASLDDFPIEVSPEEAGSLRESWRLGQVSLLLPLKTMRDLKIREEGRGEHGEVLRVTFPSDEQFPSTPKGPYSLVFDSQSLLLKQIEFDAVIFGVNSARKARFELGDFRRVDGIMVPFELKMFVDDRKEQEDRVDEIVVNPAIPAERFRRPEAPKDLVIRSRTSPEVMVALLEQVGPKPEAAADAEAALKRYLEKHELARNGPSFRLQPLSEDDLPAVGVPISTPPATTRPTSRPTTRELPRITVMPARRILTTMIPGDPGARPAAIEKLLSRAREEGSEPDGPCKIVLWSPAVVQLQLPIRPRKG